ncbi:GyrI-like domain-containing protein [uncultured Campylobacter sp.]|uniref:GyrI-like domain-containing protein n=1 Tax=uncultured Campylobacter sp. TaxID=218934 RepID=UPI00261CF093|nr:GyrI-like domain-containing protein [uncultured Campylobacter sp.]
MFDFKKEFKQLYAPKQAPQILTVPPANFVCIRGDGDPNESGGAYQRAIEVLYAVSYALKMSYKTKYKIDGFFEYVVPPLEGFWRQRGSADGAADYARKRDFGWISAIRLPDFITRESPDWAVRQATQKKKLDCSAAEFLRIDEGLCAQILHVGGFDDEPQSVAKIDEFIIANGYAKDFGE